MMLVAVSASSIAPTSSVWAKDGESGQSSSGGSQSSGGGNNDAAKKAEQQQKEAAKKTEQQQKETAKKTEEIKVQTAKKIDQIQKESVKKQEESTKKTQEAQLKGAHDAEKINALKYDDEDTQDEGVAEDEDMAPEEDAFEGTQSGKEASHRYDQVVEKIAEAEKHILEQQSEGKDVTVALERLAAAKAMLATAGTASTDATANIGKEDFLKEALKLAHTAGEEDVASENDADKFIKKATERIAQAQKKLTQLEALGGDTAQFQTLIATASADVAAAKNLLAQNSLTEGFVLAQKAEREAKSAKKAIESALLALGVDDDELSGDHKSAVAKTVEDLLYVASVEGENGVGKKVREIARAQRDSAEKVNGFVDDAQSRSAAAEFFLGPKYRDLSGIKQQITDNQSRIQSLQQATMQITDADLREIVQDHIETLTEENTKLQSFVAGKETKRGVFGWIFRLLQ